MATLNVIRRWALRDQMSIREISRRTGLARNTVKKHLRSEESEPRFVAATRKLLEKIASLEGLSGLAASPLEVLARLPMNVH